MLIEQKGDLLDFKGMIAHQCNCVSKRGKGLYSKVAAKYPESDVYKNLRKKSVPGTNAYFENVICMFAQYYSGKPLYKNDTSAKRLAWLSLCLADIIKQKCNCDIAFPKNLGCGLAGGDWDYYYEMLKSFATLFQHNVYIIEYEENKL